uniref:Uncharacterized protein n=1 Tax=Chromera velia CCMP2878 TaxID=1169474 RepID=A0A0G4FWA8_9ALVE|eukprot:Cvel_19072.t1-p1 / transcript=Cvel_19072.t1 / gene=Cvel_19072 / organism=Chromera_velia_CCMP2878 / gene_product=hypothetical protein / transcript_product=hypothetical protein / location=Cvel_scaffold1618:37921-39374(+) / protein_length=170 / sequence_SO=supercontig / SO=protein_coding / is_pseudo=false
MGLGEHLPDMIIRRSEVLRDKEGAGIPDAEDHKAPDEVICFNIGKAPWRDLCGPNGPKCPKDQKTQEGRSPKTQREKELEQLADALRQGSVKVRILSLDELPLARMSADSLRNMFVDLILTDLKKYADANQATIFGKILKGDATFVVQLKNGKGPCWKYTVMNEDDQVVG